MVRRIFISAGLILFIVYLRAFSQHQKAGRGEVWKDLERVLEDFDPGEVNTHTDRLTQYMLDLSSSQVDINRAGVDELLLIPGVNVKKALAIIDYRERVKPFEEVGELLNVKGIGESTLKQMGPYVYAGKGTALFTKSQYWTHNDRLEVFSRYQKVLQTRQGYLRDPSDGGYVGSPYKYYQRMRYRSDHLSLNLTQEKDPGEPLERPRDFDFFSGHLALKDNGRLQNLVIGDYSLSFGQGLVLWDGGAFGKGREVISTPNRKERGVYPYTSAQETDFFRGAAATYGDKIELTGFYSFRKRTATALQGDTIRFPKSNGLHRTQNERDQRNNTRQELYGGRLRLKLPFGFIGGSAYKTVFDKIVAKGSSISDRFDFTGISNAVYGSDYKFIWGSVVIFGEGAVSRNGGYGFISGMEIPVSDDTEVAVGYRYYAKDFQSFLGDGFGESSGKPGNEEGIYLGIRHHLSSKITISSYIDQYWFPAPRFGTTRPTQGFDWLGLIEIMPNDNIQFYLQLRSEIKDDEFEDVDTFGRIRPSLGKAYRTNLRAHFEYWVTPKIRIRSRGEIVWSRQGGAEKELGYLMYQDLRFIHNSKWKFDTRVSVFDTDSFDTRLYQFENDLLYVLSNEMLFGQGQRLYILANYEPVKFVEIWAKFGITIFENELVIGSGRDQIRGNRRSELGIQLRFLL